MVPRIQQYRDGPDSPVWSLMFAGFRKFASTQAGGKWQEVDFADEWILRDNHWFKCSFINAVVGLQHEIETLALYENNYFARWSEYPCNVARKTWSYSPFAGIRYSVPGQPGPSTLPCYDAGNKVYAVVMKMFMAIVPPDQKQNYKYFNREHLGDIIEASLGHAAWDPEVRWIRDCLEKATRFVTEIWNQEEFCDVWEEEEFVHRTFALHRLIIYHRSTIEARNIMRLCATRIPTSVRVNIVHYTV